MKIKLLKRFDAWFIPNHLKDDSYILWKSRLLVAIHVFLFLITFSLEMVIVLVFPEENLPPLRTALVILIGLAAIFRHWGNFILSGNLFAFFLSLVLVRTIFQTGGIYSDNLLWMISAPLLALLFANRLSGLLWLVVLLVFTVYLFYLDIQNPGFYRKQIEGFDESYYLVSYGGLFIMVVGIILVFATGQEMIIKALHEKQEELSQQKAELARQTQFLMEAEQKLIASNQELEQFAYAASHDLKEPLRMIGSYVNLIKRKLNPHLDGPTKEYMDFVTDGVSRMENLLNDLLEYSRLGRRHDQIKVVDLNEIMLVVINNLMAGMKENQAAIYTNQLPSVNASSTEMMQLFQNLISNSIKFRRKDVPPVVEIFHEKRKDAYIFHFHDNGIGIPPEHHQSVFNLFERLHTRHEYEGTGIGLATCKKIISNLGGKIWVEPEVGEGTTFTFTIPRERKN